MSEITRLAGLINHVGCGDLDCMAHCVECSSIREILADVMKRQETREAVVNPALRALHTDVEANRHSTHQAVATMTDRLNKHRARILVLEEENISTKRHLKVLDRALDSTSARVMGLEELMIEITKAVQEHVYRDHSGGSGNRLADSLIIPLEEFLT